MKVSSSPLVDFGGFELDAAKITLRSDDEKDIMLPYRGPLPRGLGVLDGNRMAHIYLNVQLAQRAKIVLVLHHGQNLVRPNRPLEMTTEEIRELLDRFFDQEDTGLAPYWHGVWQAHYIEWRRFATMTPEQRRSYAEEFGTES